MKAASVPYYATPIVILLGLVFLSSTIAQNTAYTVDIEELQESTKIIGEESDITYTIPYDTSIITPLELTHILTGEGLYFQPCEIACNVGNDIFNDFSQNVENRRGNVLSFTRKLTDENEDTVRYSLVSAGRFIVDGAEANPNMTEWEDAFREYDCLVCQEGGVIIPSLDEISINLQLRDREIGSVSFCGEWTFGGEIINFENPICKITDFSFPTKSDWQARTSEFCDYEGGDRVDWIADGAGISNYYVEDTYYGAPENPGSYLVRNTYEVEPGYEYIYGLIWDEQASDYNILFMRTPMIEEITVDDETEAFSFLYDAFGGAGSYQRYNPLGFWIPETKRVMYKEVYLENQLNVGDVLRDIIVTNWGKGLDTGEVEIAQCNPASCPYGSMSANEDYETFQDFIDFTDMMNSPDPYENVRFRLSTDIDPNGNFKGETYYRVTVHNWVGWYYSFVTTRSIFHSIKVDRTINIYKAPPLIKLFDANNNEIQMTMTNQVITVEGYNLPSDWSGQLMFDGSTDNMPEFVTNENGRFTVEMTVPDVEDGLYLIDAGVPSAIEEIFVGCIDACINDIEYRDVGGDCVANECRYGCRDDMSCEPGVRCNRTQAFCRICLTGSCGNVIATFPINGDLYGCFKQGSVPAILTFDTCTCDVPFFFTEADAVVVSPGNCDRCGDTPNPVEGACFTENDGCDDEGFGGGCTEAWCGTQPDDDCTYERYIPRTPTSEDTDGDAEAWNLQCNDACIDQGAGFASGSCKSSCDVTETRLNIDLCGDEICCCSPDEAAAGDCPNPTYPIINWDRVWCTVDESTSNFISQVDGDTESQIRFDNNWAGNELAGTGYSDYIGFKSGRRINFEIPGTYTFTVGSDDGIRVWIDGQQYVNEWGYRRSYTTNSFDVTLTRGYHDVRIDYYEDWIDARVTFNYITPAISPGQSCAERGGQCLDAQNCWNSGGTTYRTADCDIGTSAVRCCVNEDVATVDVEFY